ncbi:MAG: ATP-binding protein [Nitrospirales bacterium]|nr:ATP-binding protein [Nitrospira sp.]MDR4501618.1 ATP-binding protein [Nitrospirales bacterium]
MQEFEKLGAFYLGRPYDLEQKEPRPGLTMYDSKDLVTHAVCVGMTGSGKTGLCIGLLEEAAIDGIPALIIDPKGDLSNLLLTFPKLRGQDFEPWVNEEDAQKKGLSRVEYAQQEAEKWKNGLRYWQQSGERIARLRKAADFAVYTPGSTAGLPISILKSFAAPSPAILEDTELLSERLSSTATSLLSLIGIEADPLQSREHILLSTILKHVWAQGHDLDLAQLIGHIQNPPVKKVGILDVEAFFPAKDRFALAMRFNNLLGAPGFSTWLEGQPLDIDQLLYTPDGKPRMAIFSIAHLSDTERMFIVTLLLSQMVSWMRTQSGTTSLRALVYMDEVFGYFPPVKNPPSKAPLLTLLKQARAFGVGTVLATQNPVDLDYKGLGNAGTWFIGRLQTERDMARVLDGLEGAASEAGKTMNRKQMERTLSRLGNRVFLMNNVHEDAPEIFETRWALSYLRGPLTRSQVKMLMDPYKAQLSTGEQFAEPASDQPTPTRSAASGEEFGTSQPPILPSEILQLYLPTRCSQPEDGSLVYQPRLLGSASIHYLQSKTNVDVLRELTGLVPITDDPLPVDWNEMEETEIDLDDLEKSPEDHVRYSPTASAAGQVQQYKKWEKALKDWVYRNKTLELWKSPPLNTVSEPDESERDFRIRVQQLAHEQRDEDIEQLRRKYAPKIAALEEQIRRAEQAVEREAEQAKQQKMQTAISFGATLLSVFLGRKTVSRSSMGQATTAIRGLGRSMKEAKDVARAGDTVEALRERMLALDAQFQKDKSQLAAKWEEDAGALESISIRPTKTNISIKLLALAWVPFWQDSSGDMTPAWK